METKEKILAVAKDLFNEKGYENVRMRDISSQLGISVGNLTYHFKKKEDILKALMKAATPLDEVPLASCLADLNQFIEDLIQSIQDHLFFFTSDELFSLSPDFEAANRDRVEALIQRFATLLRELKQQGYFISALSDQTIDALVEMIMFAHLSWVRKVNRCGAASFPREKFILYHWQILEPFFTAQAAQEYVLIHQTLQNFVEMSKA